MDNQDVQSVWEEFWHPLLGDGLDGLEEIKKELFDFYHLIGNAAKVYEHITGGLISKPTTDPSVVISLADEYYDRVCKEYIEDTHGEF